MTRRAWPLAPLTLSLLLVGCQGDDSGSRQEGDTAGTAGAPSDGPPDTLFAGGVVNEILEGDYFLTGSEQEDLTLEVRVSFSEAMHVEVALDGGNLDEVTGVSNVDPESPFDFAALGSARAEYDFSAGSYRIELYASDLDGDYRLDLYASRLGGAEL